MSIATLAVDTSAYLHYDRLPLSPVALDLGFFQLRWYSLSYIAGIVIGWWYFLKLLAEPGAPMGKRAVDDLVFYCTIGVLVGGRLGYAIFYDRDLFSGIAILQLWNGGMSFHGGAAGCSLGMIACARRHKLSALRVHDYVVTVAPIGLLLGRLANFANGELWGRVTDVPWAIVFTGRAGPLPRHPSQLYEAALEGLVLGALLSLAFWKTRARYEPGKLLGLFLVGYTVSRFIVEYFREPDEQLGTLSWGLTMGQTLSLPLFVGGVYLMLTAKGRRVRVEPVAGSESVG
ncbi:prolipoprotein diacylglyceryl transferase [Sphingomonas naphthae]|uniref:Phosphatidylglycerol--prolipoprotein diacylglyceryl transferase n=1 Tax=Sphingomonas naphthae TaxID=1813468 RepID=A0ABY7TNM7_9SPHN|nr:prolipoprotein diacylglyceryl transferase [Sphingomonas naphthae]WCT74586.1 prolipoprotein diacylglyceryl transferase [Sphingomonas naphthae]